MRIKLKYLTSVILVILLTAMLGYNGISANENSTKDCSVREFTDQKSKEELESTTSEIQSANRVRTYADFSQDYLVVSDDAEGITDAFTYQNVRGTGNVDLYYQKGTNLYRAVTISTGVKCDDIGDVVQVKNELVATNCVKVLHRYIRCKKCDNNFGSYRDSDNEIMYLNTRGEICVFNKGDVLDNIAGIELFEDPIGIGFDTPTYLNAWEPLFLAEYWDFLNKYEITDRHSWSFFRGNEVDFIDVTGVFAHGGRTESVGGDIVPVHSNFYVRDLFLLGHNGKFYYSIGNVLNTELTMLKGEYSENNCATELPCKGVRGFVADNKFPGVLGEDGKIYYWENAEDVKDKVPLVAAEGIKEITVRYKDFYAVSETGELLKIALQEGKQPIVEHIRNNVEHCLTSQFIISDGKLLFTGGPYLISEDDASGIRISDKWWAKYEVVKGVHVVDKKKLIAKGVTSVNGDFFIKNGKVYKYNGKIKCVFKKTDVKAKRIWAIGADKCIILDSENSIWAFGKRLNQFGYKKRNFKKFTKVLRNVKNVWIGDDDIAYVKKGKLYSFGIGDYYYDEFGYVFTKKFYKKYPLGVHQYDGINAKKIRNVRFSRGDLIVTMKNGDVYYKVVESDYYLRESTYSRYFEEEDLLKLDIDDVMDCSEYMVISKKGVSRIQWFDETLSNRDNSGIPTPLDPNDIVEEGEVVYESIKNNDYRISYTKNVKEYIVSSYKMLDFDNLTYTMVRDLPANRIAMIMKNSDLYAWGNFSSKGKYYTHAVKVAENVKEATFLKGRKGIMYLTKKGRLYFLNSKK